MIDGFTEYHRGLTEIRIHVLRMRTSDGDVSGTKIQTIVLPTTVPGKDPIVSPEVIARIVWLRGERYARLHGKQTNFRAMLYSVDESLKKTEHQVRFMVKVSQLLEDDEEEDADGAEDDANTEAETEVEEEEPEDEDEPEEEEEADDDEEYEDEDDDDEDEEGDYSPSRALVPLKERLDPSGERHLVPQQINPAFLTKMIGQSFKLASKAYRGPMREGRIAAKSIRIQAVAMLRANQETNDMVIRRILEADDKAATRQDKIIEHLSRRMDVLETQIQKSTDLQVRLYDNFKELAREGWQAFHDAMKMKDEVVNDRIEWSRWMVEDAERRQPPPPPVPARKEGGVADLIREASQSPVVMAAVSVVLRKTGNNDGADLLEKIAVNMSRQGSDDEDDEDEPVDVAAHEQHAQPRPPTNGHAKTAELGPLGARIRRFRDTLDEPTIGKLRKAMPPAAWAAFERACSVTPERAVIAALAELGRALDDKALQMQIVGALAPAQIQEIMSIIKAVKDQTAPRQPPPRPGASV